MLVSFFSLRFVEFFLFNEHARLCYIGVSSVLLCDSNLASLESGCLIDVTRCWCLFQVGDLSSIALSPVAWLPSLGFALQPVYSGFFSPDEFILWSRIMTWQLQILWMMVLSNFLAVLLNLCISKNTYLACNFINGSRQAKTNFLEFYYVNG